MTKIIAVLNQKGGVGKTTISVNLATAIAAAGRSVILADGDPQGSARDWAAAGDKSLFPVIGMDRKTIKQDLKGLAPVDFVIIDGAPQAEDLAVAAIKVADLVVIPVQPSPYDLWASEALIDLAKARCSVTDGQTQVVLMVSRAIVNTALGNEILTAFEDFDLPVLDARTHQRVAYAESAVGGESVVGGSDKKAEAEMMALAGEVMNLLEG